MPKVTNLDAAQRTIESDSFLMQCYMATDARRTSPPNPHGNEA